MNLPVAVQLYTLRKETAADFIGTLEKVAKIGYKGVEFAGFGGISAREMKAVLDSLGLQPAGSHTDIEVLGDKLDEVIEYNLGIGNRYIVCPGTKYNCREDFLKTADFFNCVGEKCKANGLQFCYHNHHFEFVFFNGEYGLDLLYNESDPELVKAEIDTYWVEYAGFNAADFLLKYKGRCPLIHLKDMEAGEEKLYAEIGNGMLDIRAIVNAAKLTGVRWMIVEQDLCKRPALESIRISYDNLVKLDAG